jgi:hypothetical protein
VRAVYSQSDGEQNHGRAKNRDRQREGAAFENGGKTVHDDLRKTFFRATIASLQFDFAGRV